MRLNQLILPGFIAKLVLISSLLISLPASAAMISVGVLNTRDSDEDKAFWQASIEHLE